LPQLEIDSVSLILRGNFNPAIFSPGWLLAQGLIGPREANDAKPEAIVPHVSVFTVGWLRCQVTDDLLELSTADTQEVERLRDIATGILRTLDQTPVSFLGINRQVHYRFEDERPWHLLGDLLVPKEHWEPHLRLPGTRSVAVQGVREDKYAGRVMVTVEPSVRVHPGLFIQYNDHFALQTVESQPTTREDFGLPERNEVAEVEPSFTRIPLALEILTDHYFDSLSRASEVISHLLNLEGPK
jgi:hypothetical protein